MPFDYPTDIYRQQAFIRRADKCTAILNREDYHTYQGEQSIEKLAQLIKLIIWALEPSLPKDAMFSLLQDFKNLQEQQMDIFETEEVAKNNYDIVLPSLIDILQEYKVYIAKIQKPPVEVVLLSYIYCANKK